MERLLLEFQVPWNPPLNDRTVTQVMWDLIFFFVKKIYSTVLTCSGELILQFLRFLCCNITELSHLSPILEYFCRNSVTVTASPVYLYKLLIPETKITKRNFFFSNNMNIEAQRTVLFKLYPYFKILREMIHLQP